MMFAEAVTFPGTSTQVSTRTATQHYNVTTTPSTQSISIEVLQTFPVVAQPILYGPTTVSNENEGWTPADKLRILLRDLISMIIVKSTIS